MPESEPHAETAVGVERIGAADGVRRVESRPGDCLPGLADTPGGTFADEDALSGDALVAAAAAGVREHADRSSVGIAVTLGPAGLVGYANTAFRRLAGSGDLFVIRHPLFEVFPLLGEDGVRAAVSAALKDGAEAGLELPVRASSTENGDSCARLLHLTVSPIRGGVTAASDGRYRAVLLQLRDAPAGESDGTAGDHKWQAEPERALDGQLVEVNQRLVVAALREQELKERAESASKAKTAFLATMSHELRTPLNAIIGYAGLLDDEVVGPIDEVQHRHLARLKRSAQHLLTLVNDVLTLSRVEADKEVLHAERVDSESVLDEAIALTLPMAAVKNLELSARNAQAFVLHTDRGKLLQILVNLIGNAIKFTDKGEVTVGASVRDDAAEFCVTDTGIGIDAANLDHIFDMFWQVEQDLTRRVGGTGLGLNVSRRLAWLLGGRLAVESTPGKGSTFTVHLPMDIAGAPDVPTSP